MKCALCIRFNNRKQKITSFGNHLSTFRKFPNPISKIEKYTTVSLAKTSYTTTNSTLFPPVMKFWSINETRVHKRVIFRVTMIGSLQLSYPIKAPCVDYEQCLTIFLNFSKKVLSKKP